MHADPDNDVSQYEDGSEGDEGHGERSADETSVDEVLDAAVNSTDHDESSFVDSQQNAEDSDDDDDDDESID